MEPKYPVRGVHNGLCPPPPPPPPLLRMITRRTRQERRDQRFRHRTHIGAAPPFQTQVSLQDIRLFERSNMLCLLSFFSFFSFFSCVLIRNKALQALLRLAGPRPWFSARGAFTPSSRLLTIGLTTSAVDRHNIC